MTTMLVNPVYLDQDMLVTLASRFGLDVADVNVTRRTNRSRKRAARGSLAGVGGEVGGGGENERTETTSEAYDPLHTLVEVIDRLDEEGLPDARGDTDQTIRQGTLVGVEGDLIVSPLTAAARIMSVMVPQLLEQSSLGRGSDFKLHEAQALRQFLSADLGEEVTAILEMPEADHRVVVLAEPAGIVSGLDDLEDDLRVIGTAHRVVRADRSKSLASHVLGGLSREARKAIGDAGVIDLISGLPDGLIEWDGDIESAVVVRGPAIIIKPLVIY